MQQRRRPEGDSSGRRYPVGNDPVSRAYVALVRAIEATLPAGPHRTAGITHIEIGVGLCISEAERRGPVGDEGRAS